MYLNEDGSSTNFQNIIGYDSKQSMLDALGIVSEGDEEEKISMSVPAKAEEELKIVRLPNGMEIQIAGGDEVVKMKIADSSGKQDETEKVESENVESEKTEPENGESEKTESEKVESNEVAMLIAKIKTWPEYQKDTTERLSIQKLEGSCEPLPLIGRIARFIQPFTNDQALGIAWNDFQASFKSLFQYGIYSPDCRNAGKPTERDVAIIIPFRDNETMV